MKSTMAVRIKRTLIALLLMSVLSFPSVFAESEPVEGNTEDTVRTETEISEEAKAEIIKKGKNYYYQDEEGKIRRKSGFVTVDGKKYYVRKGGKIITGKTFKLNGKNYRANRHGVIRTGVYSWNGNLYYSYLSGVWRRKAGFVCWKGQTYYVAKGGKIVVDDVFTVKNIPYASDKKGHAVKVDIPDGDGSSVVAIAKEQVGIMTGREYWRWYYKTRFIDTDRTPWCGAFVAWCYNEAGLYKRITVAKRFGPLGYVPSYSRYADKYGKWVKRKKAKGGDIIVFGRNRHVGLVEGVVGKYIITIEGNAGPTAAIGCGKPGAVIRGIYKINSKRIKGIIRPGR